MSNPARVLSLVVVLGLAGCAPSPSEGGPPTLILRVVCGIQHWLERNDFRVREEGVDRCSGAARQIEAGRERAQELLEKSLEHPADEDDEPAPTEGPRS